MPVHRRSPLAEHLVRRLSWGSPAIRDGTQKGATVNTIKAKVRDQAWRRESAKKITGWAAREVLREVARYLLLAYWG